MPFVRSYAGTDEDWPAYVLRARGRDRSWMSQGSCSPENRSWSVGKMTWMVPRGETRVVDGVKYVGDEQERIALKICGTCPMQWQCARWAVEVQEASGTWAMPLNSLRWMLKQDDALLIVDNARVNEIPVARAVEVVRGYRM